MPLWALLLAVLPGCGLLSDYSGSLCNPDGSCPEDYHCVPETNRCERGPAPPPSDDGGTDGGADGGTCSDALACTPGDGCCPAACHANNDDDCSPVCGNGETEGPDEACDDGNRLNGDNCDPTCRYFNAMSTISGVPGSQSFADGTRGISRLHGPAGIATDGTSFFITDATNSTVRQHRLGLTTTLAGRSFFKQVVDGLRHDAGFASPGDVAYQDGVLYIVDAPGSSSARLRRLELDGGVVSTVDAGLSFAGLRGVGTTGQSLVLVDGTGLRLWDPATGAIQQVTTLSSLNSVAGAPCEDVAAHPNLQDAFFLACNRSIVRAFSDGGVSLLAGSPSATGCADTDAGLTTARFTQARSLQWSSLGGTTFGLFVTDTGCHAVRQLFVNNVTTVAGTLGSPGYADVSSGDPTNARFDQPRGLVVTNARGSENTFHVADFNNAAYRIAGPQGVTTPAGAPPATALIYGDAGTNSRYTQVTAIAVDGQAGLLYAYSRESQRLFQLALDTGIPTELIAFGSTQPAPRGLAVVDGTLYVSLSNRTVARLEKGPPATLQHVTGQAGSTAPAADGDLTTAILFASDLASDGEDLFFHDQSAKTVRRIDLDGARVTTIAGGANAGTFPDAGPQDLIDGVGPNARFANPLGLATDGTSLYLLDGLSASTPRSVVRKVDLATREVTTLAGDAFSQFNARDGVGPEGHLAGASGLTTDGRVLFISDPGGSFGLPDPTSPAIRMLDLSTRELTTLVGRRGQWTLQNGSGTNAAINTPGPIAFEPGRQWILFFDSEEGVFQRIR
jgi:cysteine-rich repeat protein